VASVIDPATVEVLAYVDEARAGAVAVGQKAEITLRSAPDTRLSGRVARIQIESDRVN
jgi:HlyD family secretion protein